MTSLFFHVNVTRCNHSRTLCYRATNFSITASVCDDT